jgi:uncharacterized membrane protein
LNGSNDVKRIHVKKLDLKSLISIPILFPILILILSILGTYMMNVYQSNTLIILMIVLIGLLAFAEV